MNILPVVSTKGGEGKSTQSANLAGFLADAGLRTLLIDGDHAQPTASNIFPLTYEAPAGLFELLMRTADLSHPDNIISRTAIDGLDLIVSNDPHERPCFMHRMVASVCVMCSSIHFSRVMTSLWWIHRARVPSCRK